MSLEELLLEKWRTLPPDKQQEAIDFVEFLKFKTPSTTQHEAEQKTKLPLGDRLDC